MLEKKDYLVITKAETQELINFLYDVPYKISNPLINKFIKLTDLETYLKELKDSKAEKRKEELKIVDDD